jgi:hypothetical protein
VSSNQGLATCFRATLPFPVCFLRDSKKNLLECRLAPGERFDSEALSVRFQQAKDRSKTEALVATPVLLLLLLLRRR